MNDILTAIDQHRGAFLMLALVITAYTFVVMSAINTTVGTIFNQLNIRKAVRDGSVVLPQPTGDAHGDNDQQSSTRP